MIRKLLALFILLALVTVAWPLSKLLSKANRVPTTTTETTSADSTFPLTHAIKVHQWVEELDQDLVVLESVFWDARDTISLREMIRENDFVDGADVLEIGTGSGLLALCCLKANAKKVIATDVNPAAIENANFNAHRLGFRDRLETRLVPLDNKLAFSVIKPKEKFDLIISNPPWVNRRPESIDQYALYDENFDLMKSLLDGLEDHLKPDGRLLLAYGCVDAIKSLERMAKEHGFEYTAHDSRKLDDLEEEFLPGYLVEIRIPKTK